LALVALVYPHQLLEITAQIPFLVLLALLVAEAEVEAPQRARLEVLGVAATMLPLVVLGHLGKVLQGAMATHQEVKVAAAAAVRVAQGLLLYPLKAGTVVQDFVQPLLDSVFFMQAAAAAVLLTAQKL